MRLKGDVGIGPARFLNSLVVSAATRNVAERICFIHVPKCGGTSLDWAMRECLGLGERLAGAVGHLDPAAATTAADAMGLDGHEFRDRLLAYELSRRWARYVSGHFRYPARANAQITSDWHFVTVLRDPVERWLSLYFYDRYKQSSHGRTDLDLEAYVASERGRAAGCAYVNAFADSALTDWDERIESAKANLEAFAVVGLLEQPEAFRARFKQRFGSSLRLGLANTAPRQWSRQEIDPELMSRIESICDPDRRIYEHAGERLT